ncbi:uncharacterized protein [Parasteatoda tepidariorum]|uniref:uncharacterized protein n=1 Tax=Parasteatoda tepidariorum TaxID=114398 RepID=UPI0039BC667B
MEKIFGSTQKDSDHFYAGRNLLSDDFENHKWTVIIFFSVFLFCILCVALCFCRKKCKCCNFYQTDDDEQHAILHPPPRQYEQPSQDFSFHTNGSVSTQLHHVTELPSSVRANLTTNRLAPQWNSLRVPPIGGVSTDDNNPPDYNSVLRSDLLGGYQTPYPRVYDAEDPPSYKPYFE